MGSLYQLKFPNGKCYIGITHKSVTVRFKEHCTFARLNLLKEGRNGPVLWQAIRKYGPSSIEVSVIASVENWQELCKLEQEEILLRNTQVPNGYNLTSGGEGSRRPVSAETKAKISASVKARWQTLEYKTKHAAAMLIMSQPEMRDKIINGLANREVRILQEKGDD